MAFFRRWIQPLRQRDSRMYEFTEAMNPFGEPVEMMSLVEEVIVVANRVLGTKSISQEKIG